MTDRELAHLFLRVALVSSPLGPTKRYKIWRVTPDSLHRSPTLTLRSVIAARDKRRLANPRVRTRRKVLFAVRHGGLRQQDPRADRSTKLAGSKHRLHLLNHS